MDEINEKLKTILQRNINGWSFLMSVFSKHDNPETKFLIEVCTVAIRENKKVLDEVEQMVFEPVDGFEGEEPEVPDFGNFTDFEQQSIDECLKIYNTKPKLTFLQKLLGQKDGTIEKDESRKT